VITLSTLVADLGYHLVVDPNPSERPDGLGDVIAGAVARVCRDNVVACMADSFDHAFSVAHEIAEQRRGFVHGEETFCDQANILAGWLRRVTMERDAIAAGATRTHRRPNASVRNVSVDTEKKR
jgi:hypothetical protein